MRTDMSLSGILHLVSNSAQARAANYRERAASLREMPEIEPVSRLRDSLRDLADQFEGLAATVDLKR